MNNFFQVSSLEKIMLDYKPHGEEFLSFSALKGERISYQIAYISPSPDKVYGTVRAESELLPYITLRTVGNVPSEMPLFPGDFSEEDFISTEPGLFPDVLYPVENDYIELLPYYYHSLWVTVELPENVKAGDYNIDIIFDCEKYPSEKKTFALTVIDAVLPKQELIFTQWFHCDCIASVYGVEMLSEAHWQHIEQFVRTAVKNGINMILTPIFTPPLDTFIGGERPTMQLVKVIKRGDRYSFDFALLDRWIDMCLKNGVEYFEISHLFTQWGAKNTPKIVVEVDGIDQKLFGWHTDALSLEYTEFLDAFLPELTAFLKNKGVAEKSRFHVSDEPSLKVMDAYIGAKAAIEKHLKGFIIMDALSDYEFYKCGAVENPVVSTDNIHTFIENGVTDLWGYYCCGQQVKVSNRFLAMPSYRNRIIGAQLYKFDIKGFLQWGYNFYYTQHSRGVVNPFLTTDGVGSYQSGDAFSVYPGKDGVLESLRIVVFHEALQDMRAMTLLEKKIGRDAVVALIDEIADEKIDFANYPRSAEYILALRGRINEMLK